MVGNDICSDFNYNGDRVNGSMEKAVSAADANRKFSQLLREVRNGASYVVTNHGRAVAKISAVEKAEPAVARARAALLRRLEEQPTKKIARWTREELYER